MVCLRTGRFVLYWVRRATMGVMVMAGTFQLGFGLLTAGTVIGVVPTILVYAC